MGPQHGPYSVKLDSGQASTYNANAFVPLYGVTLYYADNLGDGQHQLVITNLPATIEQELGIDYALVSSVVRLISSPLVSCVYFLIILS